MPIYDHYVNDGAKCLYTDTESINLYVVVLFN